LKLKKISILVIEEINSNRVRQHGMGFPDSKIIFLPHFDHNSPEASITRDYVDACKQLFRLTRPAAW
jgi:hypothetical protein